uniref:Uncharacterized protein n=1 Tax=Anguilla anguilla TaxID=7936 RepID=A0A0E9XRJ2_ANGAN
MLFRHSFYSKLNVVWHKVWNLRPYIFKSWRTEQSSESIKRHTHTPF